MPSKGDTPGLQWSRRKDGPDVPYWVQSHSAREAGYPTKTVKLDVSADLAKQCQRLQAEMAAWIIDQHRTEKKLKYDGTFRSLIAHYETEEYSPYKRLARHSTANADYELRKLKRTVGERRVQKLNGMDFLRWYWEFRKPAYEGGPERPTDAYNMMTRVRAVFSVGVLLRLRDCAELRQILTIIRFPNPQVRSQTMNFQQTCAFIEKAHELGQHEMAFAQAIEFDLMLRQGDVIGKREYEDNDRKSLVWVGLRWEHVNEDLILSYTTNKRKRKVIFDLRAYDLVYAEIRRFGIVPRLGPMIVDSETGRTFEYEEFRRRWRIIARAAGIPDEVQNRDSRAGGVSEARSAGAARDDIRQHAGHADGRTTDIYIRETLEPTRRVAEARTAYRTRRNGK